MSKEAQLGQWLQSMGVVQQFSSQDIESGRTVASILRATDRDSKIQLQEGNSAIVRVSNWNVLIEYLRNVGIKLTQQQKGKIINGNHDLVFKIISRLRELHQRSSKQTEINLKDIDPRKDIKQAESLLELFLLAIIKHFSLSPKEALSLLSNDCKYLAHILAKGLKGDFRPIDNLILEFSKNVQKIVGFAKNKENETFFLKAIKPALISKSESVAGNALGLILTFLESFQPQLRVRLLKQSLTPTLMLVLRRHPQLADQVVLNMLDITEYNQSLLSDMYQNTGKTDLSILFLSIWRAFFQADRSSTLYESFVFGKLIEQITDDFLNPSSTLSSVGCCLELAENNFEVFDRFCAEKLMEAIRSIVFTKESQNLQLVHLYFSLLGISGQQKHPLAPLLYKLLAGRLISAGEGQYETLVYGFYQIFEELPSIPPSTVIESLSQKSVLKVEQLELLLFTKMLVGGADSRVGVAIYNLVSRSFVQQTGLGRELADLLVRIVGVFRQEQILIDMTGKLIKVCLALYFAGAKNMSEKRKPLSHKTKLEGEEATNKLKMLEIEYFLKKAIELGDKEIVASAEPLLCFSYIQLAALGKEQARGLEKIIALLGDPAKLIAKYEKQLGGQSGENKSRVKHQSPQPEHESRSPQIEGNTTEEASNFIKSAEKRSASSRPLHPMSLSMVAVKNDACLGLQKYTKLHQKKILAEQAKRYQAIALEEQKIKQKKAYEKKVALEKGLKLRGVSQNELNYIFQFDTKEVYAQSNHLYLNFYDPEAEEERDAQGVEQSMRRYEKALRVYFNIYSGKKMGFHTKYFDEISDKTNFVHSSSIYKMLKDHGLESEITPKEVQILTRRVNYKLNSTKEDPELLDFQGFKALIIQLSFTMFTRPPRDFRGRPVADMLEELFFTFKLYASQNRVNQQLFEDPETCFAGQQQAVKLLNRRLQENPDYILPEGYKKIVENRVFFDHKIYLQAMSLTYKQVYQVLDQMLFDALKIHIIEPFTRQTKVSRARPNVYVLDWAKLTEVEQKHLPINFKKQVAKFPMKERASAKEAALVLADIVRAVELNHDQIGLKHENPLARNKREKQQQLRRAQQAAEARRLNATRQLKSSMQTYKQAREQKMKKKEESYETQLRKKREEKERRERRQKQLKVKLQEYNQKKKEDEESKKLSEQAKLEKERQLAEKKKRQLEETKRKIEDIKKQKEAEEKEKKQKQKQEEKRKKEEERKKLEKSQVMKKQRIQEYKSKKKGDETSKVLDAPPQPQEQNT